MARKISQQAANAFTAMKNFKLDNTKVIVEVIDGVSVAKLLLHNNIIAVLSAKGFFVTNAGWFSKTTKERLNALPNVNIYQKKGEWYLNNQKWNGAFTEIQW